MLNYPSLYYKLRKFMIISIVINFLIYNTSHNNKIDFLSTYIEYHYKYK